MGSQDMSQKGKKLIHFLSLFLGHIVKTFLCQSLEALETGFKLWPLSRYCVFQQDPFFLYVCLRFKSCEYHLLQMSNLLRLQKNNFNNVF